MTKMIATKDFPGLAPGTEVEIDPPCVQAMVALGRVVYPPKVEPKPEPSADAVAEYVELTGREPDGRWRPETLARKIEDARTASTYLRRDMIAED